MKDGEERARMHEEEGGGRVYGMYFNILATNVNHAYRKLCSV